MTVRRKSSVSFAHRKLAADTQAIVHPLLELEDQFSSLYNAIRGGNVILEPSFNPLQLIALCFRNSILQQCVHAMEVNVDGTGYMLELPEAETKDEAEKDRLTAFFDEPFPGQSFVTIRRKLRVDMEQTGTGYLEVIENTVGDIIFLRHIEATTMRLVQYDAPVMVEREIMRDGEKVKAKFWVRERRYVQMLGSAGASQQLIYYKDYSATRNLNRLTGQWVEDVPAELKASKVLMFVVDNDPVTAYGLPRWINNTPSVLGGRKTEEFNLEFFDSGGLPPAIIFIQGGALTKPMEEQLLHYLGGGAKTKYRAAVVAVQSASGSLDTPGKVDVRVERFGDSRQSDAMFQTYEKNSEDRIQAAFRLPPIFLGKAADYSFASAMTSYRVAEAQVFEPERLEFDEIINTTIMRGLKAETYSFKSKPIILQDTQLQVDAVNAAKDKLDGDEYIETINELTGLSLEYSESADAAAQDAAANAAAGAGAEVGAGGGGDNLPAGGGAGALPRANIKHAMKNAGRLLDLAEKWVTAVGLAKGPDMEGAERKVVMDTVRRLTPDETALFNRLVSARTYADSLHDPSGLAEISGCATNLMVH